MNESLRDRLRRLGVHRGSAHLRPAAEPAATIQGPELDGVGAGADRAGDALCALDGREHVTRQGVTYVIQKSFEVSATHGNRRLSDALTLTPDTLAYLARSGWPQADLAVAAFIDTETTGLAGGAGTLAFLVGVGRFDVAHGVFNVVQFFLRHPGEEPAMIAALEEHLVDCQGLVTFNGRGFDVPLLQARFVLNRAPVAVWNRAHLDLLLPARRLWRERLSSCALSSLETHVLDVQREQADVPGYEIPQLYFDYLQSGDASAMPRVLYHNSQDILSMVTLAARLGGAFMAPLAELATDPLDMLSLGRWYEDWELGDKAECVFRSALEQALPIEVEALGWQHLGQLLKRQARYDEAHLAWERLAALSTDIGGHVELAKYYEWRTDPPDIAAALKWTQQAIKQVEKWPPGPRRNQAQADLLHRQQRLERRQSCAKQAPKP